MPFQSEKQRRYMHANLPRIAKRWERDYANGGIASQGGMKNYLGEQPMVNAPQNWRSGPDSPPTELAYITDAEKDLILRSNLHGSLANGPNEGPSGIMSLDGWGDASQGFGTSGGGTGGTGGHSYGDKERYKSVDVQGPPNIHGGTTRTIGPTTPKDTFKQSWSGQPGFLGFGGGYRNLKTPGVTPERGGAYQSRFGLGSLLRGAMSMFGGIPGKIGSMLSHINPGKLRGWNEQYGRYNTQDEYEQARTNRRNTKRMDYLSDRKSRGLGYGKKAYADLLGQGYSDPFQEALNRDLQINPETTQFSRSHLQSLANKQALTNQLSTKSPVDNYNYNNMAMMEVANNPALSRYKKSQEFAPTKFNDPWAGATVQQIGMNQDQLDAIDKIHKRNLAVDEGTTNFFEWYPGKKHVEDFVENIKGRDKTKLFSDTPKDIVYGDPTIGATTQEIQDYINSLSNVHGPIKNQNPSGYAKKNLIGIAQGGRVGYGAGGLASLWPR